MNEIIYLICKGLKSKEIAGKLKLSFRTIEQYRLQLNDAFGVDGPVGIIRYGIASGLDSDEAMRNKFSL